MGGWKRERGEGSVGVDGGGGNGGNGGGVVGAEGEQEEDDDDDAGGADGGGGGAGVDAGGAVAGDEAEIPAGWLALGRKLGKGAFGDVMEGNVTLKFGMGSRKEPVACKAIQDASKEADLMRECRFHMKLNHANIVEVSLHGTKRNLCVSVG